MKILILTNNDVGLYQFRRELLEAISKKADVIISLPYGSLVDKLTEKGYTFEDTKINRRGINPFKDFSLLCKYVKLIKKHRPDLVITYTIKPNIYGGIACRLTRTKYCENITGLGTAFQKEGFLRSFVIQMYKFALKKVQTVFFENSDNLKLFTSNKIVPAEKTVLLSGAGVNLEHYSPKPYPVQSDRTEFLFIGRVMKEKGIYELIYAVDKLKKDGCNCILNIIGACEEHCEDLLSAGELAGNIKYFGYIADVRPYIENCHCFVLPSYHEGMANTNLECSAMARPVITSDIPGCREEVVGGESGFLVKPQDGESLYRAMKKFISLPYEEKSAMGQAAHNHVKQHFDKRSVVAETLFRLGL